MRTCIYSSANEYCYILFHLTAHVIISHLHGPVSLDNIFHGCISCERHSLSDSLTQCPVFVLLGIFPSKKCPHQLVHEPRLLPVRADRQITAADSIQLAEATVNYNDTKSRQCGGVAD